MLDLLRTVFKYKEKRSPDKLGRYPEALHTSAMPERRYLWSSRLLVIFAALSICFNIMLASSIYVMLPQKNASPMLFHENKYFSQLSLIERHEKPVAVIDLLTESFLKEYILLRHSITGDYGELMLRWGPNSRLFWMSTSQVYHAFATSDLNNNINEYKMRGLVRLADVEWLRPLSVGFWQAQFITMDYYPNQVEPVINIWRAYIRAKFAPIPMDNKSLKETNPFGFLVTNYAMSYVGTPDDPLGYMTEAKELLTKGTIQ